MRFMIFVFILCVSAFPGTSMWAATVEFGPQVGDQIPAPLRLNDIRGASVGFDDVAGPKGVVVAFVRSAAWCPYCQLQLKNFQIIAGDLNRLGYPLVAVSYDTPDILSKFAKQHGLTYALLSDQGSKMIDAFGIRDRQYNPSSFAYGVPHPVVFVIDKTGIIRAKLAEEGYKTRPELAAIVAAAAEAAGTQ